MADERSSEVVTLKGLRAGNTKMSKRHIWARSCARIQSLCKVRDLPDAAIGFGKKYPEFWINKRDAMRRVAEDSGVHICLRAPDVPSVNAFHAAALKAGGASDGDPGVRMHYDEGYYAAFIRDPDGNRIEAVRFLRSRV